MVGPVSNGPLLGAPKLFLAHTTIGGTTGRLVGSYAFSCQPSTLMQRSESWIVWKRLFLVFLTSPIIPSISRSQANFWGNPFWQCSLHFHIKGVWTVQTHTLS